MPNAFGYDEGATATAEPQANVFGHVEESGKPNVFGHAEKTQPSGMVDEFQLLNSLGAGLDAGNIQRRTELEKLQPFMPIAQRKTREDIQAMKPADITALHQQHTSYANQQANEIVRSGLAMEGETYGNPIFEMARQQVMDEARKHVKSNPQGAVAAGGVSAAQQFSGMAKRVVERVTGQEDTTALNQQRQTEKAIAAARAEEHPYATAIMGAGGKLVSPEMVAGMVAGAPVKGASMLSNMARGAGAFTGVQTAEQNVQGETMTPIKNAAINAAMMGAGGLTGAAGEALGGGIKTVAAKAIGGGVGQAGVSAGFNAAEGKEFSGPQAAADLVAGAAGALAHAPTDLASGKYAEHVREIIKQNPGISTSDAHSLAKEITRAETSAAQPTPSVSESTPIAAKEIANAESVRNPNEAGNVARGTNEPAPAPVVEPSVPEVVAGKGNVAEPQSRDVAPQIIAVKPDTKALRIPKAILNDSRVSPTVERLKAEGWAQTDMGAEVRFERPKGNTFTSESEAQNVQKSKPAGEVLRGPETSQVREGVRGGNAQKQETPLQVPQGEGRGPAKPARENAVTFKTSQGSTYTVGPDGGTIRNKASHIGHDPADVGAKDKSDRTVYVSPESGKALGMHGTLSGEKRIVERNGKLYAASKNAAGEWGVSPSEKEGHAFTTTPEVGKSPVEFWKGGDKWHAGNPIIEVSSDRLQGRTSLLEGPGGSTGTDKAFREQTSISNLTDKIATMPKPIGDTRVAKMMASAQNLVGGVKDSPSKVGNQLAKLRAGMAAIYHAYASEPGKGDFDTANRKWSGADNESAHEVEKFRKEAKAKVPDPIDRQAVSIFLESGGDAKKLAEWKAAIDADPKLAKYRRVFDRAANLPDNLKAVSTDTDLHHQATLDEAVKAGVLKDGLENYIMHVWKDPEVQRKIAGEASFNSLITNPSFAKKRVIPTYFEGIKRGLVPESLDFADLTAVHERSFREALAARGYIKTLYEGKAKDGRPLATVSPASARTIEEGKGAVLIHPNMKAGEPNGDYKAIDHPSLRGWKWAATVDGKPVMVQGDMMVHPEIYQHLKNNLTKSAIQQWEVNLGGKVIHPGAIALKANAELKHLILSLSAFHQTTLGVHALEHRTKPFGMPELDFSDPVQKDLVQHGLMVAHYSGADAFNEGLSGGGLISKVPGIGPRYQQYADYLFKSYLPRIKMAMAQNALKRNTEVYGDKLTKDQILNLSADQANAAFGGVNLRVLGRSKTFQDVARLALMAPDFLEARARFVGQAAKPYGREQATALIIGALGMYTASKLLNAALSKDHDPRLLDPNPFSVHVGDSDYAFRTIQGDIVDAIEDPLRFMRNRFSPLAKFTAESATGKDRFGQQQDLKDRVLQAAKGEVPIPFQPWVQKPEESAVQKTLESIFKMVGINKKSTTKEDMSAKKSELAQRLRSGQSEDVVEGEVGKDALTRSEAREVYSRSNYVDDAAYNFTNLRTDKMVSNLEAMKPADRRKPLYRDDPSGYSYLDRAEDSIGKSPSLSETDRKALQKRIDKLKSDKR